MIKIKNVKTLAGAVVDFNVESSQDQQIDAQGRLLLFPGVTDPHICFAPLETDIWRSQIRSCVKGGVCSVVEIPSEEPHNQSKKDIELRNKKIEKDLITLGIPLNCFHYLAFSKTNLADIDSLGAERKLIQGNILRLNATFHEELDDHWDKFFKVSAQADIPIVINSVNENTIPGITKKHGKSLLQKAIYFVEKWGNRLLVLDVSTQKELELIQEARKRALLIYAETTPQILFFGEPHQTDFLWEALNNEFIEMIGTGFNCGHQEMISFEGVNYSASDPLFFLPQLLTAVHSNKLTIEKLSRLTSFNVHDILELRKINDFVLIDLDKEKTITRYNSGKSSNETLKGWPAYTIVNGQVFKN